MTSALGPSSGFETEYNCILHFRLVWIQPRPISMGSLVVKTLLSGGLDGPRTRSRSRRVSCRIPASTGNTFKKAIPIRQSRSIRSRAHRRLRECADRKRVRGRRAGGRLGHEPANSRRWLSPMLSSVCSTLQRLPDRSWRAARRNNGWSSCADISRPALNEHRRRRHT